MPGKAKVLKSVNIGEFAAQRGDIVYLLTYRGEGFYKGWFKGTIIDSICIEGGDSYENVYGQWRNTTFEIINAPQSIWWVKIKNGKGQTGWSNKPDNFDNKDRCG